MTSSNQDSSSPQGDKVTPALYSAEEVIRNFEALMDSLDFKAELVELGIGSLQLGRRKKTLRELKALSIGLWSLALQRSFPQDAAAFFAEFRERSPRLVGSGKEPGLLQSRVGIYVDLLKDKKETDFLPVASYLAEVLALDAEDMRRLRLKVSLITRSLYKLIFDRLV